MLNNVSLVGRLTKDPEIRIIGSEETKVCNFTVAVNRSFKDANGERQADFIQCQVWKQKAEFVSTYLKKGNLVSVTGEIHTRTYEKEDKTTAYVTEINVNQVESLEKKPVVNSESIKADWTAEWEKRSLGLDAPSKATLKAELKLKYDKLIADNDLPY